MNYIYQAFAEIDCFGTNFNFFLNRRKKFKTFCGGIITIITLLLIILCLICFGKNLYQRKNPTINQTNINADYSIINFKEEKLVFAFRFENLDGEYVDISNKIYPIIYYYSRPENDSSNYLSTIKKEEYLSYHICNDDEDENFNLNEHYGKLFCIDFNNKEFGGYWDNSYIYYFEIRLYFCLNGEKYSKKNPNCTSFETLNKIFNNENPILFSLYYPVYYFDFNSVNSPLVKYYRNYFYYLNYNLQKNDRLYIKRYILNDDKGILFGNNQEKSVWGVEKIIGDFSYFSNEELNKENSSSLFYLMNIYMSSEKTYFKRYYTKIQDVIAEFGGLISVISSISKFFCDFINEKYQKIKIIEFLFDMKNKNNSLNYHIENNDIQNMKINNKTNYMNGKINIFKNEKKNFEISTNSISNTVINVNNKKHESNILLSRIIKNLENKTKDDSIINESFDNLNKISPIANIKKFRSKKKEEKLTLILMLKLDLFLYFKSCISSEKTKCMVRNYSLIDWFYIESCEIMNYLLKNKILFFLENYLMNEYQLKALLHTKKISINDINQYQKKINDEDYINKIISYYKDNNKQKNKSTIDDFIFEILDDKIKINFN